MKYLVIMLISGVAGFLSYFVSEAYGAQNELPRLILAVAFATFFAILLVSILSKQLSMLLFFFALYHLFFFLLPGMIHFAQNAFPFYQATFPYDTSVAVSGLILLYSVSCILGIVANYATDKFSTNPISDKRLLVGSLMLLFLSVPCIAYNGISFDRRAASFADDFGPTPANQILHTVPSSAMFICAILTFYMMMRSFSYYKMIAFIGCAALALAINNPLQLSRFTLFARLIALLYITMDLSRVRLKIFCAVIIIGSIFTVFPAIDYFARGDTIVGLQLDPLGYIALSGDFDGVQSTVNVYEMVQVRGLSWGWNLLGAFLSYIPREIWPDKAYPTGMMAGVFAQYPFTNLSAPMVSEIYVDFGTVGVAVIPFFIGWLVVLLDRRAALLGRQRGHILNKLFFGGLIGYETIVLRGSLIAVLSPIYAYFGLLWVLSFVSRPYHGRIAPLSPAKREPSVDLTASMHSHR
jgi:hypothetical protein